MTLRYIVTAIPVSLCELTLVPPYCTVVRCILLLLYNCSHVLYNLGGQRSRDCVHSVAAALSNDKDVIIS